jgi:flagellar biosynthesis GTPase FlhF
MQLYTYRARSLAVAMELVRAELGPDASVLHTRDISSPLLAMFGSRTLEVTASNEVDVPSRLPESLPSRGSVPAAELSDFRRQIRGNLRAASTAETSLVERLATSRQSACRP